MSERRITPADLTASTMSAITGLAGLQSLGMGPGQNMEDFRKYKNLDDYLNPDPVAKKGILSTLGRLAGPVGGAIGIMTPKTMGDATLKGDEKMLMPLTGLDDVSRADPNEEGGFNPNNIYNIYRFFQENPGVTVPQYNEIFGTNLDPKEFKQFEASASEGTGITSGLAEVAQETQALEQEIDAADDYAGVMNALRGDKKTIEERRSELAIHVGSKDADVTPESVLTLVQPTLNVLDVVEQEAPEGGINSGMMQAPDQQEAIARMAMGEQPVKFNNGGDLNTQLLRILEEDQASVDELAGLPTLNNDINPPPKDPPPKQSRSGVALSGLETVRTLQDLVPEATGFDTYMKRYKEILGDGKTGYELNPYIASLNLASAIANAPKGELLQSILAPETIKAVSDPILQMAQAKSKTDQAIKLKALDAATKSQSAEATAKSDIMMKAIPELMKGDDFTAYGAGDDTIILNKRTGAYETIKGKIKYDSINMDDGRVALINPNDRDDVIYLGDKKGENKFDIKPVDGGAIVMNKQTGHTEFKSIDGLPVSYTVHGNGTDGFFKMDKEGNISPITEAESGVKAGPPPTDLKKNIDALAAARARMQDMITNNVDPLSVEFKNTQEEITALAYATTPLKGSEFERLLDEKVKMIYNSTAGTESEKQAAANKYRASALDDYITAKNTVAANYNPNEAMDKEFAKLYAGKLEGVNEKVERQQKLAQMSGLIKEASNHFETGAFAKARLTFIKMIDAVGGREKLRGMIGDARYDAFFTDTDNDKAAGEVIIATGNQFAIMLAEAFPGNLNVEEIRMISDASPNIYNSREGLAALNKIFENAANAAQAEQEYTQTFVEDPANKSLSPEEKYIKYNIGLTEVQANNPILTTELKTILSGGTDEGAVPAGGIRVTLPNGGTDVLTATQRVVFDRVQSAPDVNSFLADWQTIISLYPEFKNNDPTGTYNMLKGMRKSN